MEHVAAPLGSWPRTVQQLINPAWKYVADGCHVNRYASSQLLHTLARHCCLFKPECGQQRPDSMYHEGVSGISAMLRTLPVVHMPAGSYQW